MVYKSTEKVHLNLFCDKPPSPNKQLSYYKLYIPLDFCCQYNFLGYSADFYGFPLVDKSVGVLCHSESSINHNVVVPYEWLCPTPTLKPHSLQT